MKYLITLQTLFFIAFCFCGFSFFRSVQKSGFEENLQNMIELTENYKRSVNCIKQNFEQSNQVVPQIEMTIHSIGKALVKAMDFTVFGSKPLKNEKHLKASLASLIKTSIILKDYREKTAPEVLASLEKTENSLNKLNVSLREYQTYNRFYLYGCSHKYGK